MTEPEGHEGDKSPHTDIQQFLPVKYTASHSLLSVLTGYLDVSQYDNWLTGFVAKSKYKIQALFKDFQGPKLHFSSTKIIDKKLFAEKNSTFSLTLAYLIRKIRSEDSKCKKTTPKSRAHLRRNRRSGDDRIIGKRKRVATFDEVSVLPGAITRLASACLSNERSANKTRVSVEFFVGTALNSEASAIAAGDWSCSRFRGKW